MKFVKLRRILWDMGLTSLLKSITTPFVHGKRTYKVVAPLISLVAPPRNPRKQLGGRTEQPPQKSTTVGEGEQRERPKLNPRPPMAIAIGVE